MNYRLSKWLSQLQPEKHVKPTKPVEGGRTVEELLRGVNFALSRMAVLASDLVPQLRKIISDAKGQAKGQADPRRQLEGGPFSPGCRNPERMAERRGIQDVKEIQGVISHLERILEDWAVCFSLFLLSTPDRWRMRSPSALRPARSASLQPSF